MVGESIFSDGGLFDKPLTFKPLVRYVDESQAVLDAHVNLAPVDRADMASDQPVAFHIRMTGPDGYVFEHRTEVRLQQHGGMVRFEMAGPQRWWPAGMGDQTLYHLKVTVSARDRVLASDSTCVGLTSVRPCAHDDHRSAASVDRSGPVGASGSASPSSALTAAIPEDQPVLLVNGRECSIQSVVAVDPVDESHVLPVGGDSLLVIRNHYGPDVLYDAADRAGILMVQSVPLAATDTADDEWTTHIDRLATHPCLAGWLVKDEGGDADRVARRVQELDPTRSVFRHVPGV